MKRLSGGAVLAFVLGSIASLGCGGSSGNKVSSALDSLPNAPVNQQTATAAAGTAASAAAGAERVPQASDFSSTPTVPLPALAAMTRSNLPSQQRAAVLEVLALLGPQAVTSTCPAVTDNSTYPTGTKVDITLNAGAGCTTTTGETLSGSMSVKGTIDASTGAVSLTIAVDMTVVNPCTPGSTTMTLKGSGSATATGLTLASTAFTVSQKTDLIIGASGTCAGQAISGSGFIYLDASLKGTKSGTTWTFDASELHGVEVLAGGAKLGEYADWKGTVTVDTKGTIPGLDDIGTVDVSGTVGWDAPMQKGKMNIALKGSYDHAVCSQEPVSGTLTLTSGSNNAVVTFDGATSTCRCAPWTLNGAAVIPNPLCW